MATPPEEEEYPSGLLSSYETDATPDDKRIDPENPGKFEWIYNSYEAVHDTGTYGKWLIFKDFNNLKGTWNRIIAAKKNRKLQGCVALKTSTKVYRPGSYGPGPCTTGVVEVYTTKEERKSVGESLCLLVKQDIMYKTEKATRDGLYAGNEQNKPVTLHTMSYNGGHLLLDEPEKKIYYQAARDIWHLNIVDSPHYPKSEPPFGKWIIELTKKEATGVWHMLKNQIEDEKNGILRMECPKGDKNSPFFYVYTTSEEWESVGERLRQLTKRNIMYKFEGSKEDFILEYIKMEEEMPKDTSSDEFQRYEKKLGDRKYRLNDALKSEGHIRRLAEKMIEWEEKFKLFHLEEYEVHDIKHGPHKDSPSEQRIAVLHEWISHQVPEATYGDLLEVFIKGGFIDCATAMLAILKAE